MTLNDGPYGTDGPMSNDMGELTSHRCDGRFIHIITFVLVVSLFIHYCFNCHTLFVNFKFIMPS